MNNNIETLPDSTICKRIGERLKSLRLRENITQEDLAKSAVLSVSTIKSIEKGEIKSFDSFLRIMRTLGKLSVLQELVDEEEMTPLEYYEFVNSQKKHVRKRANGKASTKNKPKPESEW